jgi:fructose-bisphosphate aldolase, class I
MNTELLLDTAKALFADNKGLIAMDESNATCNQRFALLDIPQTEEVRRAYRELIVTTQNLKECISGAILFDETIRQTTKNGIPFAQALIDIGIIPGIKLDSGAKSLAGRTSEKVTEGLDGLRERLTEYSTMGAKFAKWRAVFSISESTPSRGCIEVNSSALARYAALCQEVGLVPIVEPEVLMEGDHTIDRCKHVTEQVIRSVFHHLYEQRVMFEAVILKPNMVVPGLNCKEQNSVDDVATATIECFMQSVPAAVAGIAFLSGGQPAELATSRLNAMNVLIKSQSPWPMTFSFSRALHQPAMEVWRGKPSNIADAQKSLLHRAKCNRAASGGEYSVAMETSLSE